MNSVKSRAAQSVPGGTDSGVGRLRRLVSAAAARLAALQLGGNGRPASAAARRGDDALTLLTVGNSYFSQGAHTEAIAAYRDLLRLRPRHTEAINNLGAAHFTLGNYRDAEDHFRSVITLDPDYPEAHSNLGTVLRWTGRVAEAETSIRRALELRPECAAARSGLGMTLILLGRVLEAKTEFEAVLEVAPGHVDALLGLGQIAQLEGRFELAEVMFKRVLQINPKMPVALAGLAGLRRMTASDHVWLEAAQTLAASGIAPSEEAGVRFAIGKYYDDVEDFDGAFQSYKLANELLRRGAEHYDREAQARFVDAVIHLYTRDAMSQLEGGGCASAKPVFVVGMERSGTSLVEQIIASHPRAKGAGELPFWTDAVREHRIFAPQDLLGRPQQLAEEYLRTLEALSGDARRVVDKALANCDHLGVIHSVFPNARIIYMQRDPIDTCLSCYFQSFSVARNYTMDLSDLAHFYRQRRRLMAHWRKVLPPGTILDVQYEDLIADQNRWTRKILDFAGLDWNTQCLDFHSTNRFVLTASTWQVRQRIYKESVGRWRNYRKYIGPLLSLSDLD